MKIDYIIVGLGIAGLAFVEKLIKNKKTFIVFENNSQKSSKVAAGMFNPVILKRFTPVWNGEEQLEIALPFFKLLENRFKKKYIEYIPIHRVFKSIEEQNNWFVASDKPKLTNYIRSEIVENDNIAILAEFGLGVLNNTGKVNLKELIIDYNLYLSQDNLIIKESFNYEKLIISDKEIKYHDFKAHKIVFCEGFGLKQNTYFNYLPMNEAKGELLTIHAPNLNIDFVIKSSVFILPLGNDLYKVGATFNWKDKTSVPTKEGESELLEKLNKTIDTTYSIVNHVAGIRPTVKDRRPLIGIHPLYKNLAILNGLGTRGVMLAPTMSEALFQNLENNMPLEREIDIKRFETDYFLLDKESLS